MTLSAQYVVVFERTRTGYSAYAPDLPGCVATGKTRAIIERRMREAIDFHVEGMRADGERIPKPSASVGYVRSPNGRVVAGRSGRIPRKGTRRRETRAA